MGKRPMRDIVADMDRLKVETKMYELFGCAYGCTLCMEMLEPVLQHVNVLDHPRYLTRAIGIYKVKEFGGEKAIASGDTAAEAVCRALLVVTLGRGHDCN